MLTLPTTAAMALGLLAFFGAMSLLIASVSGAFIQRRDVYRNLRNMRTVDLESSSDISRRRLSTPVTTRILAPAMRRATELGRRITPSSVIERLEQELAYAGSPAGWDAPRILAFKVMLPALMILAVVTLGPIAGLTPALMLVLLGASGFIGYYLPEWVVRSRAEARQRKIQRTLPDALDLLSITVEAGLGFDAAVARVSREIQGPLGEEFHRVVQEMQLGAARIQALRNLGDRNRVAELKSFVLAMIQADILGVAIGKVLQVQANEMRIKRRQRAEEQAQKLPVKIVFPLIFCIFPALFVVLLGPAVITIWETIFAVF